MTFNGIAVRDVIRLMTPFLTESQRVSKHAQHLRRGGKKLDPELSIRAYAKYQEVKEFPTEARRLIAVAGALRLAKSGENETDQKVKKRVARLVAAGRREEEDRRHAKREQEAKTGHLPSTGDVSV